MSESGLFVDVEWSDKNIALFVFGVIGTAVFVVSEIVNIRLPYSKFAAQEEREKIPIGVLRRMFEAQINNRLGFFILYFVPLVSYVALWTVYALDNLKKFDRLAPSEDYSIILLVGWCATFAKRCFEVLFVHIYSGTIPLFSTLIISGGYSMLGLLSLYWSNQVFGYKVGPDSPTFVKDVICFILYIVGISVNAYAHWQLRQVRLRKEPGSKKYYAPHEIGILFKIFICPHYIFEIIMFCGFGVFGATVAHYTIVFGVLGYLGFRTRATYKWYKDKGLLSNGGAIMALENKDTQQGSYPEI